MMNEFPAGLCVDCGMSVPGGDIICDICKGAWQTYSYTAGRDLRRDGPATVQQGIQEFLGMGGLRLVSHQETSDAPLCGGEEGGQLRLL
jgi:hypothetical protein